MPDKYAGLRLRNQLCFPIYAVSNLITRKYKPLLDKLDLTYTQYIVMMVLWEEGQTNEKTLCETLCLKSNTVTPLLKKLQNKGYIEKAKDSNDGRNLVITLTEAGRALQEKALCVPECMAKEFHLSSEEAATLYTVLYKIINTENEAGTMKTVYDFTVKDRKGNDVSLSEYEGKVLLIVNTATGCGFTPHYEPLEAMYKEFKDKGFEILDFPCNQFANQAPGDADEIHQFCTMKFGTEFPQFKRIDVNGDSADPLFAFLASEKPFEGFGKGLKNAALNKFTQMNNKVFGDKAYIKWNFTKFLVDREGKVIAQYEPTVDMKDVRDAVAAAL